MSLSPLWLLILTLLLPLPFGTDRRGRRVPWVTYTLISLNILVYFCTGPAAADRWGLIPAHPHFIALLTGLFLHASLGHLVGNMLFLWVFGAHVEEALGPEAFLALYLGGGIAASLLHMSVVLLRGEDVASPLIGASGAISAILAPFAVRFHRANLRLFWIPAALFSREWSILEVPAISGLGLWLFWNIAGGLSFLWLSDAQKAEFSWLPLNGNTAYWAHIGGFVFGLVAAELTGLLRDGRQDYLLQDARRAAAGGHEALDLAIRKYRSFLEREPDNGIVRAEMAHLLAAAAGRDAHTMTEERVEAAQEMLGAIRLLLNQKHLLDAARCVGEAVALGLSLPLTARERLRLAGAAEEAGQLDTALLLLGALIAETPDVPEDEMARLKLGQLLQRRDPKQAGVVLAGFLTKYPDSPWAGRAREIQMQTNI
jgi:membrane associated rhomboid family serine protease